MLRSKSAQFALGCTISVGMLIWLFKTVDWPQVMVALEGVRYQYFLLMAIVLPLHFVLRAIRWKLLLPAKDSTLQLRFDAIMVGNIGNFFLPLRAGEFLRPLFLSGRSEFNFPTSFISLVLERFFDLSCVLVGFSFLLYYLEGLPDWIFNGAYGLSTLAVGILFFIFLSTRWPSQLERLVETVLSPLSRLGATKGLQLGLVSFAKNLIEGAYVLKDLRNLGVVIGLTFLIWAFGVYFTYFSLCLFGSEYTLFHALTVTVILALAVAAPSAPGFIGVYQVACVASFGLFGLDTDVGAAFAIVSHLFQYCFFVFYIFVMLLRGSISMSDFHFKSADAEELPGA